MNTILVHLTDSEIDQLQQEIENELGRRLLNRLTIGTKVETLRAGFGGGGKDIRYVIGHVYPGDVNPGYVTFPGSPYEGRVPDSAWDREYILLANTPDANYNDRRGSTYLLEPANARNSVKIIP